MSLDDGVGERLDRVGYLKAECPGRLQVNDELKFDGLQDRQIGGLRAFEDLTNVDPELTIPAIPPTPRVIQLKARYCRERGAHLEHHR